MAFLGIHVSLAVSLFLIVLGPLAAGLLLPIGIGSLMHRESAADIVPALVLRGLGVFLLLMTIAAFRGLLRGKESSGGGHHT
jgi:hypothetical protein